MSPDLLSFVVSRVTHHALFWPCLGIASISFVICFGIILIYRAYPHLHSDDALRAVQASHRDPTPRLGGVAIFSSLALAFFFVPRGISLNYFYFIFSASILFGVGLVEDLTGRVSPWVRLQAAFIASLLFISLRGIYLHRVGLPWVDGAFSFAPFAILFTVVLVTGISNGFNMIDGVNGLAAIAGISACIAQFFIARSIGYGSMQVMTALFAVAIFGFFVLNFPFGKIFLGDAGAYTIGFVLAWFGILILARSPDVSPWAILLTVFWPFFETAVSFTRRAFNRASPTEPDHHHTHQIVMRVLSRRVKRANSERFANPISTLCLAPFVIFPPLLAVIPVGLPFLSLTFVILILIFYCTLYFALKSLDVKTGSISP